MNKKVKLTILLAIILSVSIVSNGCFGKNNQVKQNLDSTGDSNLKEDNDTEKNDDISKIRLPSFSLWDLDDNPVSSDIFKNYDMTIVSIWQST